MKVLVYPKDENPYQRLLYSKINKSVSITYLKNPTQSHTLGMFLLPFQLIYFRLNDYKIFHLHWVFMFQLPFKHPFFHNILFRIIFTIYFLLFISLIKLLGYRLVWTIHDLLPHENYFTNNELISIFLSKLSDAKIVHSQTTLQTMKKLGFNTTDTELIQIGNYIGAYKNNVSKQKARSLLNINKNDFVFGYFGKIEKYKGICTLVESFRSLKVVKTKLLIAGSCNNKNLKKYLINQAKENPNIILYMKYISDNQVQRYINCTDILVYPFTSITTSSSVILAMSFGKPVIAPLIGDIRDMPKNTGIYYHVTNNQSALSDLMRSVINNRNKITSMGKKAYQYIEKNTWDRSASLTFNLYQKQLNYTHI